MADRPHRGPVDVQHLSALLRVLGTPNRLAILQKLQVPQSSSQIRVRPFRQDEGRNPERPISRQAVEGHLKKLVDAGLVRARPSTDAQTLYVINQPRLFTLADEVRRLTLIRPAPGIVSEATRGQATAGADDGDGAGPRMPEGPSVVLAAGPLEGTPFALKGRGPWTIGRGADADVRIAYDPFLSAENTEMWRADGQWFVRDLGSKNGTTHNWRLLDGDEAVPLGPGDTVGAGRSLLVFRDPGLDRA